MMNNCWFRVRVTLSRRPNAAISLTFAHPTQPGNHPGGWMTSTATETLNSSPISSTNSTPFFSLSDVRSHSSPNSAWIILHNQVYDCTSFLKHHPGGPDTILINAGSDCTEEFDAIHSHKAKSMLQNLLIGNLIATPDASALTNQPEKILVTLVGKTEISRSVRLFRFALRSPDQILRLPAGKHILLCTTVNDKLCIRAYTPTSPEDAAGYFELMIRIYFRSENPSFPAGGLMTQHLDALPVGAVVEMKGPLGRIEYAGKASFFVEGRERRARRVAMVAGGTGITALYGVIRAVMREEEGVEMMHLVYASRSEEEMLMRKELDWWARERKDRFRVCYVVGKVTEEVLRDKIPMGGDGKESLALVCGPPGMVEDVVLPSLERMGYSVEKDSCLVF